MSNPNEARMNIILAFILAIMIVMTSFMPPRQTVITQEVPTLTEDDISQIISTAIVQFTLNQPEDEEPEPVEEVDARAYTGPYTDDEIEYLAMLVTAEAGNQPVLGKRLVIDTVLNRVEHPNFPNTIREVIDQTNQFSPVVSGSIYRYSATDEMVALIREEIEHRTDPDVIFFRANEYGPYGIPMYKLGGHYFSSYD